MIIDAESYGVNEGVGIDVKGGAVLAIDLDRASGIGESWPARSAKSAGPAVFHATSVTETRAGSAIARN